MLARDTRISVDGSGGTVAVQELRPGDQVFDILSNRSHRVLQVKSRAVAFDRVRSGISDNILQPVKIKKGSIDGTRPLDDLVTSPAQELFVDRTPNGRRAELFVELAFEQLSCGKAQLVDCAAERYYAIFTSTGCPILANGLLVTSYDQSAPGG